MKFTPENIDNVDKEYIARRLANLIHVEHLKNAIPDSITFLEMYNVKEVDQSMWLIDGDKKRKVQNDGSTFKV